MMKPCPFCGGEKVYMDGVTLDEVVHHFLVCKTCCCEGPIDPDETIARLLWNARVTP